MEREFGNEDDENEMEGVELARASIRFKNCEHELETQLDIEDA